MKWINKGNELEHIYCQIVNKEGVYLFGAGEYGAMIHDIFHKEINILGFIDNDKKKQGTYYKGKRVYSLEEISIKKGIGIVLTLSAPVQKIIKEQLIALGYKLEEQVFSMEIFMSVYKLYKNNKVYFPSISFLPSTRCNLNCEACLNFTPYMEQFDERDWKEIKQDIDYFFNAIDYIVLFHISGGEPMLYPRMRELVAYIDTNYRHKIGILRTVTNGTIVPSNDLLESLARHRVEVTVDDYRDAVPGSSDKFNRLLQKLKEFKIIYQVNKADQWIDLAPFDTDHSSWDESALEKKFNQCNVPWQELRGGKLYSCNYASYAVVAGIIEGSNQETFDITNPRNINKKELVEFRMGYNEKGYVPFCKQCSGYVDINPNIVPPARQIKRTKSNEVTDESK